MSPSRVAWITSCIADASAATRSAGAVASRRPVDAGLTGSRRRLLLRRALRLGLGLLNLRLLSYAVRGERIVVPTFFAGRPPVGGVGLGCQPIRFAAAARFGALGSVLPDSVLSYSKSPRRIFRRGLNSCNDEDMPVICPTCQNVFAGSLKRPDHATLHGVVFDIFVERSER